MTSSKFPRFEPADDFHGRVPLFIDTNAIVAHLYARSAKHEEVRPVIQAIGSNDLPYYPLVTNQYVLDEIISLLLSHADARVAHQAVERVLETETVRVLDAEPSLVDRALDQFREYEDQAISLTDHVIAVQADDYGIDHIFSYDAGFRTLGFTALPHA
ncbi:type II toxin-antitoxin system VapC family toxin [Halegenticoccus tardaugens]|uniref:type II toxin-antitoxin system VapC family toxin n=1 Tax=Halegenticoccus tardaugens TaxID=2071624 RepID=UPI00100BE2F7|nr:PIN domain-containing protein [Halegenticoccus tardaugens]